MFKIVPVSFNVDWKCFNIKQSQLRVCHISKDSHWKFGCLISAFNVPAFFWTLLRPLFVCFPSPPRRNYGDIELLFQLLRAFTGRFLCNMTFLKEYMEEEIPKNYTIAQKRALFFRFVDFSDPNFGDELKAKVRLIRRGRKRSWYLYFVLLGRRDCLALK